jgi:hypothetical protein
VLLRLIYLSVNGRVRVTTAAADRRPGQRHRNPLCCGTRSRSCGGSWAPPGHGCRPPTGRSWPPYCTGSPATRSAGSGCWCAPTQCCAGTGTCWPAATRPDPEPVLGLQAHPRRTRRPDIKVAASTVWEILRQAGIDPAPDRASTTWARFLRSQADALLACDFLETITLGGTHQFVLAVIEHAARRIRILGTTPTPRHPGSPRPPGTSSWIWSTQAAGHDS